jgi:hypothetical protein
MTRSKSIADALPREPAAERSRLRSGITWAKVHPIRLFLGGMGIVLFGMLIGALASWLAWRWLAFAAFGVGVLGVATSWAAFGTMAVRTFATRKPRVASLAGTLLDAVASRHAQAAALVEMKEPTASLQHAALSANGRFVGVARLSDGRGFVVSVQEGVHLGTARVSAIDGAAKLIGAWLVERMDLRAMWERFPVLDLGVCAEAYRRNDLSGYVRCMWDAMAAELHRPPRGADPELVALFEEAQRHPILSQYLPGIAHGFSLHAVPPNVGGTAKATPDPSSPGRYRIVSLGGESRGGGDAEQVIAHFVAALSSHPRG